MDATRSRTAKDGRSRQALARRKAESIEARRQALIDELASLRAHSKEAKFAENALELLTRWWTKANWNARERLLKDAIWLIRVERHRQVQIAL